MTKEEYREAIKEFFRKENANEREIDSLTRHIGDETIEWLIKEGYTPQEAARAILSKLF